MLKNVRKYWEKGDLGQLMYCHFLENSRIFAMQTLLGLTGFDSR